MTIPTRQELEADIRRAGLNREEAMADRLERDRLEFELRRSESGGSLVGSVISSVLNFGNQAGLGLPNLAQAALTAPVTAAQLDIPVRDAFSLNRAQGERILNASPAAAAVGRVGAFVAPTPARAAAAGGFRLAGGERLARAAASSPSLARSAALQLSSAFVGGAGAIAATQVPEGLTREKPLGEVVSETLGLITSPTNIILSGGLGGLAAAGRARTDPAVVELVEKAKRVLGPTFKPTPDMLRSEGGFISGLVESLSRSPFGRRQVARLLDRGFYRPLRDSIQRLKDSVSPRATQSRDVERGASAVRARIPTEERAGLLQSQRQEIGRRAFSEAGDTPIDRDALTGLLRTLRSLETRARRQLGTEGGRGEEFRSVISGRDVLGSLRNTIGQVAKAQRQGKNVNVTAQMLENIRQRLAPIARFGDTAGARGLNLQNLSQRDVRDAKVMYRAIRETLRRSSPRIDQTLRDIADLRSAEATLKQVANTANLGSDMELARAVFRASNFRRRWTRLVQMLPTDRVQALRGAYLADFLDEVSLFRGPSNRPNQIISLPSVRRLFDGRGKKEFQTEVFDTVLPGVRREIEEMAQVSNLILRSVGRGEGSATARRMQDLELVESGMEVAGLAVGMLKDPSLGQVLANRVLGAAGMLAFTSGLLNGRLADRLNRLASGGVVRPNQIAGAAVSSVGGAEGLGRAALSGLTTTAQTGGEALSRLAQ